MACHAAEVGCRAASKKEEEGRAATSAAEAGCRAAADAHPVAAVRGREQRACFAAAGAGEV